MLDKCKRKEEAVVPPLRYNLLLKTETKINCLHSQGTAAEPGNVLDKGHRSSCRKNASAHTHTWYGSVEPSDIHGQLVSTFLPAPITKNVENHLAGDNCLELSSRLNIIHGLQSQTKPVSLQAATFRTQVPVRWIFQWRLTVYATITKTNQDLPAKPRVAWWTKG